MLDAAVEIAGQDSHERVLARYEQIFSTSELTIDCDRDECAVERLSRAQVQAVTLRSSVRIANGRSRHGGVVDQAPRKIPRWRSPGPGAAPDEIGGIVLDAPALGAGNLVRESGPAHRPIRHRNL